MSIGLPEIIIVLVLALLVFGPKRLPQMGKSLGRGVREFKKAADTAKSELGLDEVTSGINDIKSTITEPVKEVTDTFGDLKKSVDVKSAIEAPVGAAAAAGAVAAGEGAQAAGATGVTPAVSRPGKPLGDVDAGPETPDVTPATVFADVAPAPEPPEAVVAPEAPEAAAAEAPEPAPEAAAATQES